MYELTYIVNPNLTDAEVAAQTDKVRGFINELGGEIKTEKLGEKRKLAYPIKKQGFGFYVSIDFNLEPDKMEELEKRIKIESGVLRHLAIVKDERALLPRRAPFIRIPREKIEKPFAAKPTIQPEKEKVKIEEIDKKLEELLEE